MTTYTVSSAANRTSATRDKSRYRSRYRYHIIQTSLTHAAQHDARVITSTLEDRQYSTTSVLLLSTRRPYVLLMATDIRMAN